MTGTRRGALVEPGLVDRIRTVVPALRPADQRVAEYIVANPSEVVLASVGDVAAGAGTSPATVVRLCQKLGLRGFQHLKVALAQDLSPKNEVRMRELTASSPADEILATVVQTASEGLASIPSTIDAASFDRAVAALVGADRILVTGVGSSAATAQDGALHLGSIGLRADAPADSHHQHLRARLLDRGDVLVAISNSGATSETIENGRAATEAGATVIALTGYRRSPLADQAGIVLVAGAAGLLAMRTESMTSRIVHLAVLDALVVAATLALGQRAARALDAVDDVASRHRY